MGHSYVIIILLGVGLFFGTDYAFADITITTADNDLAQPGCLDTAVGCYTPNPAIAKVGEVIRMINTDSGIHTFTSGTVDGFAASPDTEFDSGILGPGDSFEFVSNIPDVYPYYCTLHVWMQGTIIVEGLSLTATVDQVSDTIRIVSMSDRPSYAITVTVTAPNGNVVSVLQVYPTTIYEIIPTVSIGIFTDTITITQPLWSQDGIYTITAQQFSSSQYTASTEVYINVDEVEPVELMVTITESAMGDGTHVYLEFSEIHVNYEMIGMQNDEEIFTIPGHAMEMTSDHHIDAVGTPENPLDIKIVSLGIGVPGNESNWTGPVGTVATIHIVSGHEPEPLPPPISVPPGIDVVIEPLAGSGGLNVCGGTTGVECFIPAVARVEVGGKVMFANNDHDNHTFTSGTISSDIVGTVFDSGMLSPGEVAYWEPRTAGEYSYICLVHPWANGLIIVTGGIVTPPPTHDTTPPKILKPTNITVDAENSNGARVTFDVIAIDDTDQIVRPTCNPSSGAMFSVGTTTVTCNARDSAGNRAPSVSFSVTVIPPDVPIPDWIKTVASVWCDDKIADSEFISAIQYLIENNIITISETSSGYGSSQEIPNWVKNNACWWSQDLITGEDFATGIEYLVQKGIIRV